jgi:hypothetical protein
MKLCHFAVEDAHRDPAFFACWVRAVSCQKRRRPGFPSQNSTGIGGDQINTCMSQALNICKNCDLAHALAQNPGAA